MDRKQIVERLRDWARGAGGAKHFQWAYQDHRDTLSTAADLLAADGWVKVSERLPDPGHYVVCCATDNETEVAALTLDASGRWIYEGEPTYCHTFYIEVTHWRPLPPEPDHD